MNSCGINMVASDLLDEGTMLIVDHAGFVAPYQDRARTTKGQAVQVVQEGLADVLAWLRASGHHLPGWRTVDYLEERLQERTSDQARLVLEWRTETEVSFGVRGDLNCVKIAGL